MIQPVAANSSNNGNRDTASKEYKALESSENKR